MRVSFATLNIDGLVIIGEGEKDHAPMLFNGEKVGKGTGPCLDVAVDPVEGTNLLAYGRPNAISVVGVAPHGPAITCRSWWCPAKPATWWTWTPR